MLLAKCLRNETKIVTRRSLRLFATEARAFTDTREANHVYTTCPIDPLEPKFNKILIANRGEIACRIMKTARAMGIQTVAVHSEIDGNALHVQMADEAICLGGASAADSYLRVEKILDAVRMTGSEAVHPGYGFLSENTLFAAELEKADVVFIGPNSKAILAMGDKIHSKSIAASAKTNLIRGFDGEVADEEMCVKVSRDIGYPVMIKASAGGGGKGMRVAHNDKEARDGFRLSKQEAASSFGDDRMLIEKYIESPRHIEVQVLCDKHGNAIWLNERECSVQRRNQKVIEEAPSSFVTSEMRQEMGQQAVRLARAVGYDSAGTVEFLVDPQGNFYFLEMNTRLQVEHPITECITGVDLVQQMLRIAYGHKLPLTQEQVPLNGWAFESRVYAEDPYKGFGLPSVGSLSRYVEPRHFPSVRCDSGVQEGSEISIYYDPLICKLVTYGKSRTEALEAMTTALDNYVIRGVAHNIPLLRDITRESSFRKGDIATDYLPKVYPEGFKGCALTSQERSALLLVASALHARKINRNRTIEPSGRSEVRYTATFHELGTKSESKEVVFHGISENRNSQEMFVNGKSTIITGDLTTSKLVLDLNVDGLSLSVQYVSRTTSTISLSFKGTLFTIDVHPQHSSGYLELMKPKKTVDNSSSVISPMPGAVKVVNVKVGDVVSEGQELIVLEAMKMQNSLVAGKSGKVKTVCTKVGDTVEEGEILVELL